MRRHPALQALSREHHGALSLGRALRADAGDFDAGLPQQLDARLAALRARVECELLPHFRVEERELLPLSECGDAALLACAEEIRRQHKELRALSAALTADTLDSVGDAFGRALVAHVRYEERQWFPALEAALDAGTLAALERRLRVEPLALITGYHRDEDQQWVAELDCGHAQHVRHQPPWKLAEWVTRAAGRADRLGQPLPCPLCRMPRMPPCAVAYRSSPTYDATTVPAGLLRTHDLKADTWGRIEVLEGRVAYVLEDEDDLTFVLRPGVDGVVAPGRPHHIEPAADARLRVVFLNTTRGRSRRFRQP